MNKDCNNLYLLYEARKGLLDTYLKIYDTIEDVSSFTQQEISDYINDELKKLDSIDGKPYTFDDEKDIVYQMHISRIEKERISRREFKSRQEKPIDTEQEYVEGYKEKLKRTKPEAIRNPDVRAAALKRNLENSPRNEHYCEACYIVPKEYYAEIVNMSTEQAAGILEAHHIDPRAETGETVTALDRVILICGNCHAIEHSTPNE